MNANGWEPAVVATGVVDANVNIAVFNFPMALIITKITQLS